jgi:hypothetical protein
MGNYSRGAANIVLMTQNQSLDFVHDLRFDTEWTSRGCSNSFLVTQNQSPEMMKAKWDRLSRGATLCETETQLRLVILCRFLIGNIRYQIRLIQIAGYRYLIYDTGVRQSRLKNIFSGGFHTSKISERLFKCI